MAYNNEELNEIRKMFNKKYQCNTSNLSQALGITNEDFIMMNIIKTNKISFNEVIQLAQLKTLLEIKDILIDNAIDKATRLRPK